MHILHIRAIDRVPYQIESSKLTLVKPLYNAFLEYKQSLYENVQNLNLATLLFPHLLETFVGADVFDTDINKNCVIMLMYSVVKNIKTIFCWEGILDFPLMRNDKNGPFRAIKSFRAHFYLKSKSIVLKFSAGSGISKNFFGFLNFGGILVSSPQKFYNIVHRSNF